MRPQSLAGVMKQDRKIIFVAREVYNGLNFYRPAFVIPKNEMRHGALWILSSHDNSGNAHGRPLFHSGTVR